MVIVIWKTGWIHVSAVHRLLVGKGTLIVEREWATRTREAGTRIQDVCIQDVRGGVPTG